MRILIAGLGAIGQRHARNLRALQGDGVELLAYRKRRLPFVVTESLERDDSRDVERELGITACDDLDEALDTQVDGVFVCGPTSQHLEIAQRAADAGCHLFVEKPLSHTIDGVERLRETVASRDLVALVGCQWRYHPCMRWLRDLLHSQALGRLVRVEIDYGEYLPDWHPYEDYRTSYAAKSDMGGGVVLTQIHDYDLAWWLFGPVRAVTASGGHLSTLEIDVEDTVDAQLECERVVVSVHQSFACRTPHRTVRVAGERGSVTVDLLAARTTADPGIAQALDCSSYRRNDMFLAEAAHFIECLAGRATPAVPIDDGVAVLKVAIAVKDSLRTGHKVVIN